MAPPGVRLADLQRDGPAILRGARDFVSRMDWHEGIPQTDGEIAAALAGLAAVGLEVMVAEHDGTIIGGIGVIYGPYPWRPALLAAAFACGRGLFTAANWLALWGEAVYVFLRRRGHARIAAAFFPVALRARMLAELVVRRDRAFLHWLERS